MAMFYGWWIVIASAVVGFYVAGTVFYSFTAFVDPLVAEFGWSYTDVSLASSLRGLEMGIFAPIAGVLVDRYGPRKIILLGLLTTGAGLIVLSRTNSLFTFYLAFLLLALGAGGCTSVVVMAAVANWFRRRVGLALGLAVSGFGAAGLMIPVVVWLIDKYQWRTTLVILGIGAWVIGLPLALVIRNKPEEYGLYPDGDSSGLLDENGLELLPEKVIGFWDTLKDKTFLKLSFAEAMRFLAVGALIMHVMPYLNSIGVPRATAGFVAAAIPIISMTGRSGFGIMADIVDKRYIMAFAYAAMSLGLLAFTFVDQTWALILFLVTFSPGYGGAMTMRGAIIRDYFGRASFGKVVGLTMGIGSITGIIGPTLAGWIYDTYGSYRPLWAGFTFLGMLGVLSIMSIKEPAPGGSR